MFDVKLSAFLQPFPSKLGCFPSHLESGFIHMTCFNQKNMACVTYAQYEPRIQKTCSFCSLPGGLLPSLEISLKRMERPRGGEPGQQLETTKHEGEAILTIRPQQHLSVKCLSKPNLDHKSFLAELRPNCCLTELEAATTAKWLFIWTINFLGKLLDSTS